mmetsp:Transcript_33611/g.52297  ORF Transcript_33611/g.52297 Transcript_33611/m.52297 type:complete len:87 (+) Transcript_33611:951-1211(+)
MATKAVSWCLGFTGRIFVPSLYLMAHSPDGKPSGMKKDYEMLMSTPFKHLIGAHGYVAYNTAKEEWMEFLRGPKMYGPDFMKGKNT